MRSRDYCLFATKKGYSFKEYPLISGQVPLISSFPSKTSPFAPIFDFLSPNDKYTTMKQSWIKKAYTAFWKILPFNSQKGYSLNEYPSLLFGRIPPYSLITLSNYSNFDFKTFISIWRIKLSLRYKTALKWIIRIFRIFVNFLGDEGTLTHCSFARKSICMYSLVSNLCCSIWYRNFIWNALMFHLLSFHTAYMKLRNFIDCTWVRIGFCIERVFCM